MRSFSRNRANQRGAVSLLIALIVLIAATLLLFYTGRTSLLQVQMAANDVRERQVLAAAQAGADYAASRLNDQDCNGSGNPCSVLDTGLATDAIGTTYGTYRVTYCSPSLATTYFDTNAQCANTPTVPSCTAPTASDSNTAWVVSCGWSDDNTARRRIIMHVGRVEPLPNLPKNPLISKGAVATSSSITVMNYFTNLTVWSGNNTSFSGGSSKTFVRSPTTSTDTLYDASGDLIGGGVFNLPSSSCSTQSGTNNSCGNGASCNSSQWVCTSSSTTGAPDVVSNDTSLSRLSDEDFFANFFGYLPADYKLQADIQTTSANFTTDVPTNTTKKIIWVDGDIDLSGLKLGTETEPVVLIVNGDVTGGSASFTLFGSLFVMGDVHMSGGPKIFGAMMVEGSFGGSGGPEIVYDPVALKNLNENNSKWTPIPGGWRDW